LLLAIEKVISKELLEYSRVEKGEIKEDYLVTHVILCPYYNSITTHLNFL